MVLPDFLTREPTGDIHLTGHRIGLVDIVSYYNEGLSAEALACHFPTLSLAKIHKTIGFYLENQAECDAYVAEERRLMDEARASAPRSNMTLAHLRERLDAKRRAEMANVITTPASA